MQEKQCTGVIFYDGEAMNSFRNASAFKGKKGRIATLPDVVDAKLSADDDAPVWHKYFATSTGEYFGSSRGGNKILIVGHNVGPFANQERVLNGEFKQGFLELGRTEFRRLESGIYGPVEVFDMKEVCDEDSYDSLHSDAAKQRKLLRARLGPRTDEFLDRHEELSRRYLAKTGERVSDNCIIQNEHDFSYRFLGIKRGQVVYDKNRVMYKGTSSNHANLLRHGYWGYLVTIEQPNVVHHSHHDFSATGVISAVNSQKFSDAARFIAMQQDGKLSKVTEGIDGLLDDIEKNIDVFMVSRDEDKTIPLPYCLEHVGDLWFTQYREEDDVMQSGLPECPVVSMKEVSGPSTFRTEILGYYGFFKYELDTVRKLLPKGANAYIMDEPHNVWEDGNPKYQDAPIRFFRVEIDPTKRVLTPDEARSDYERILTAVGEL